jgi:hypothetical protein
MAPHRLLQKRREPGIVDGLTFSPADPFAIPFDGRDPYGYPIAFQDPLQIDYNNVISSNDELNLWPISPVGMLTGPNTDEARLAYVQYLQRTKYRGKQSEKQKLWEEHQARIRQKQEDKLREWQIQEEKLWRKKLKLWKQREKKRKQKEKKEKEKERKMKKKLLREQKKQEAREKLRQRERQRKKQKQLDKQNQVRKSQHSNLVDQEPKTCVSKNEVKAFASNEAIQAGDAIETRRTDLKLDLEDLPQIFEPFDISKRTDASVRRLNARDATMDSQIQIATKFLAEAGSLQTVGAHKNLSLELNMITATWLSGLLSCIIVAIIIWAIVGMIICVVKATRTQKRDGRQLDCQINKDSDVAG